MDNLGKANVKVELLASLPNVSKNRTIHNFDVTAHSWNIIQNSPYFTPLLGESVTDPLNIFSAAFPSRRKAWVNNFVTDGDGDALISSPPSDIPYILWKPMGGTYDVLESLNTGVVFDLVSGGEFEEYPIFKYPGEYPTDSSYTGPKWEDASRDREPPPDDKTTIKRWLSWVSGISAPEPDPDADEDEDEDADEESDKPLPQVFYINQTEARDGLWWGMESGAFLNENMPFWVTIKRENTPTTNEHETAYVVSMGIDDEENAFDLYLSSNKKPRLIDYYKGRDYEASAGGSAPTNEKEFDIDLSKMIESDVDLELGFMTIGGRFIIFVNKTILTYTRVLKDTSSSDDVGKLAEAKIAAGKLRLWGTNTKVVVNVSPMVFADLCVLALPVPTVPPTVDPETGGTTATPGYNNIKNNGDIGGNTTCLLPSDPDSPDELFGVDAETFFQSGPGGGGGMDEPSGFGFHRQGEVLFSSAGTLGLVGLSSSDFYVMAMRPSSVEAEFSGSTWTILNGGAPYWFRLKGGAKTSPSGGDPGGIDVTKNVLAVTTTHQAPDYFSVKGTANLTLYNKGGIYDFLKFEQRGIRIQYGWGDGLQVVFTGLTLSAASSETPGRETLEVACSDYTFILSNTPIVNSPFYDGMVMYYAVKDLVNRAGINIVINDWESTSDYFLPSGYAFSKPAVRFASTMMLFECIINIVKRGEAFIYFDENGSCHVKKLPGGLFSVGASEGTVDSFTRDPAGPNTILDEKNVDYNLESTANRISVFTLDRDTRNAIVYTKSAGSADILKFRKVILIDQPAYGEYEVAVAYAEDLAQRVFAPIRKTSFSVIGDTSIVRPLDFIVVDGEEFRVLSVARKYDAASNSFTSEYNAEWLGG